MRSNEKIIAGIKARNLGELNNRSLGSYVGKPQSLSDLIDTASKADLAATKLTSTLERLKNDIAVEERRSAEQFESLTSLPRAERQKLQRQHMANFRLELLKRSSDERFRILKEVREHADNVEAVKDLYATPAHMLFRHNLGGEARAKFYNEVRDSGPVELTTAAGEAASRMDKDMAAAVARRYDGLRPDQKKAVGFSKNDLAAVVMGEEYKKAQEAFAVARNRFNESINANRAFESSGKTSGGNTIRRALDRRAEGDFAPTPEA